MKGSTAAVAGILAAGAAFTVYRVWQRGKLRDLLESTPAYLGQDVSAVVDQACPFFSVISAEAAYEAIVGVPPSAVTSLTAMLPQGVAQKVTAAVATGQKAVAAGQAASSEAHSEWYNLKNQPVDTQRSTGKQTIITGTNVQNKPSDWVSQAADWLNPFSGEELGGDLGGIGRQDLGGVGYIGEE